MARSRMRCEDCPVLKLFEAGWGVVDAMRNILPADVGEHLLDARKEMLLALRSIIDHKLSSLEDVKARKKGKRATRIKVK
jgi:hypothetical protein